MNQNVTILEHIVMTRNPPLFKLDTPEASRLLNLFHKNVSSFTWWWPSDATRVRNQPAQLPFPFYPPVIISVVDHSPRGFSQINKILIIIIQFANTLRRQVCGQRIGAGELQQCLINNTINDRINLILTLRRDLNCQFHSNRRHRSLNSQEPLTSDPHRSIIFRKDEK